MFQREAARISIVPDQAGIFTDATPGIVRVDMHDKHLKKTTNKTTKARRHSPVPAQG